MALWGALADFMVRNQLDTMIGCASIPMLHNGVVSGDVAEHLAPIAPNASGPIEYHVRPRLPLPVERRQLHRHRTPALIKGYLRLGARVLGAPAWDPISTPPICPCSCAWAICIPVSQALFGCLPACALGFAGWLGFGHGISAAPAPGRVEQRVRTKSPISGRVHPRLPDLGTPAVRRQRCWSFAPPHL